MKTKSILIGLISIFALYTLVFQACLKDPIPPIAHFYADTTSGDVPLLVNFIDESTNATSWQWEFGDGETSILQNPSHTYTQGGEFTVTLTATGTIDPPDTEIKEYYINVIGSSVPTEADFFAEPTNGIAPFTVDFFDQSSNYPSLWLWWFGDGIISTQENPTHIYYDEGEYTVSLTVQNEGLLSDTETKEYYIYVGAGNHFIDPRDGQSYNILEIGSQTWFIENLNYETSSSSWYNNNSTNGYFYGRLYNWEDAITACPEGWHLPSDDEWKVLEMHFGMSQSDADTDGYREGDVGLQLKSTIGWAILNGTNSSGFLATPGGVSEEYNFGELGNIGAFWTATEYDSDYPWTRVLSAYNDGITRDNNYYKELGLSVRCVSNLPK